MNHPPTPLWMLVAVPLATGCLERPNPDPLAKPVATIAGNETQPISAAHTHITLRDYRAAEARLRFNREDTLFAETLPDRLKTFVLDSLIEDRLVQIEATRLNVSTPTAAVALEIKRMKSELQPGELERLLAESYQTSKDLERAIQARLLRSRLLKQEVFDKIEISDAEVEKVWNAWPPQKKTRPTRVRAAQIVVRSEEEGRAVLKALKKGADFEQLARERSITPEAIRGGDLGWFSRGMLPQVFDDICFPLEIGKVSELTASTFGYHVCKALEREAERPLTLAEAKPKIIRTLMIERQRDAETEYFERLKKTYAIVKHEIATAETPQ